MSGGDVLPIVKLPLEAQYQHMRREFAQLQRQENPRSINFTTSLKNRHKNRYLDILANEATIYPPSAVDAHGSPPPYINGNLINLGLPHTFVACQAPVAQGISDFLSMLYDNKIVLVMMVTKLQEGGIIKADRYWPEEGEPPIEVPGAAGLVLEIDTKKPYKVDKELNITQRYLVLRRPNEPPHKILQVQYTGWPDHGVPQSAAAFEKLLSIVKESPTTAPIVVHCSAGIGRTGTLIGAYGVLTHLERGTLNDTTVYDVVAAMKRQRFGMVQRVEQYVVIYLTLMSRLGADVKALVVFLNQQSGASAVARPR
ncbi:putative tyrosine specific protein phosphatase [Trypanosoma grayi]|uniref:putative tyrosine specific protein phosphatase n=1 Tax=Trypanosoma grayi TaxID=71804 RepID=UPI0004F4AECC|nr:putative tyrosine specific protein phosphatase [Trypanosoma grayi]KEG10872.1 putative tyrosine specific protein phosphatase [Trypanosoma grayi]